MSEQAHADLRVFGATPEQIAQLGVKVEGPDAERRIEIEPENVDAVRLFLRMQSQWKVTPLTTGRKAAVVFTGLDYTALPVLAAGLGIAVTETVLDGLGLLEAETLRIRDKRLQDALRSP